MEFMGVGPLELMVILLIALLVVGPNRLPEIAAQMGRFMRTFQRYSSQVTREFNETMHELEREYDATKGDWKAVGQGLDETATGVTKEIEGAAQDAKLTPQEPPPAADGPKAVAPPQ